MNSTNRFIYCFSKSYKHWFKKFRKQVRLISFAALRKARYRERTNHSGRFLRSNCYFLTVNELNDRNNTNINEWYDDPSLCFCIVFLICLVFNWWAVESLKYRWKVMRQHEDTILPEAFWKERGIWGEGKWNGHLPNGKYLY